MSDINNAETARQAGMPNEVLQAMGQRRNELGKSSPNAQGIDIRTHSNKDAYGHWIPDNEVCVLKSKIESLQSENDQLSKLCERMAEALLRIPEYQNTIGWNDRDSTCNAKNHTDVLSRAAKHIADPILSVYEAFKAGKKV